ncbi:MAG: malate dehydrogenase [Pseudomonadota bacterium]
MQIAIIGVGNVGATLANILYRDNKIKKIILIDLNIEIIQGKSLDIMHSCHSNTKLYPTDKYADIKNSDIVITCAGKKRDANMSRKDLLQINEKIITDIAKQVYRFAPNSINIVVTNPVDTLTYKFYKESKFRKNQIIGMAGVLDSNRFKYLLSQELNYSIHNISTMIIGEHNSNMTPLIQYTTINNIPLTEFISLNKITTSNIKKMIQQVKNYGKEIIQLQQTSAFYSTASSIAEMIYALQNEQETIMTGSAICNGEYGIYNKAIGLPIKINSQGISILENLNLTTEQLEILQKNI